MKIILLKDTAHVGRCFDVKEVKAGFARNFLIPKGLAELATEKAIKRVEALKKSYEAKIAENAESLKGMLKKLEGKTIKISVPGNSEGTLYAGIDASQLVLLLKNNENISIPEDAILLKQPIKTGGEHVVHIKFGETEGSITFAVEVVSR